MGHFSIFRCTPPRFVAKGRCVAKPDSGMEIRDRIKRLDRVPANSLKPHPSNWRTHPPAQADALCGALAEIGYADALIARELPDGSLQLLDGHLRAETTPNMLIPVLVTDLTEEEGKKLLLTLDPLAGMAEADGAKLEALLRGVETNNPALEAMLAELAEQSGISPPDFLPVGMDQQSQLDEKSPVICPSCGHEFTT